MEEQRRGSNDDDSPANKGEQMIQGAGAVTQFRKGWDCQMTRTWALKTDPNLSNEIRGGGLTMKVNRAQQRAG